MIPFNERKELPWGLAQDVARDLFDREVDPNEVQKLAAIARTSGAGPALDVVDTIVRERSTFLRTGRTLAYYEDMQAVCQSRLATYRRASAEQNGEFAWILGWAGRLMRYYATDAGYAELERLQQASPLPAPKPATAQPTTPPAPVAKIEPRVAVRKEWVTIDGVVNNAKASVKTEGGIAVPCKDIPYFQVSQRFRADVTYEDTTPVRALFKSWK